MSRKVDAAAARAEATKRQLRASAQELKERLSPATLAGNAADGVRDRAEQAAADGIDFAVRRPGATAAIVAAIGLFFARKPLLRRLRRRKKRRETATDAARSPR